MQDTKYFVDTDTNEFIELQSVVVCAILLTKSICAELVYIDFFARKILFDNKRITDFFWIFSFNFCGFFYSLFNFQHILFYINSLFQ